MRRVQKAHQKARDLLNSRRIKRPWVDVYQVASQFPGVQAVEELDLDDDISGALVPVADGQWLILVNKAHSETRRRFTVAHELGHLLLHHYSTPHADRRLRLRDARSSEGSAFEEIEANQFAAELLMPREFLLQAVDKHSRVLQHEPESDEQRRAFQQLIGDLAERFRVSEQAMTIRIASLFS